MKPFKVLSTTFLAGLLLLAMLCPQIVQAQGQPTLGTYPNTTVVAGKNTTVTPSAAPANAQRTVAYTSTNFTGVLSVNPTTGIVTVTDAKQAGTYSVTVRAFRNNQEATRTFTLTVTNPGCSLAEFVNGASIPMANGRSSAIGDFNGDMHQDVAAVNYGQASVSVSFGNGLGGFNGTTSIGVGIIPRSITVGDFNGDGNQDFATANIGGGGSYSIRLGTGQGSFSGSANVTVTGGAAGIATGDFNGDGKLDLAIATGGSAVAIRLGDGSGAFNGNTNVTVANTSLNVAIGDFNGDGNQDIAASNNTNGMPTGTVSIRFGTGSGTFSGTADISVGQYPQTVAIADFNGDGKQDFATVNQGTQDVSIRLGNGTGSFPGTATLALNVQVNSLAIGDFNGDGNQDVATVNVNSTTSIFMGNGTGAFSSPVTIATMPQTQAIVVGDFNEDGLQDFGVSGNSAPTMSIRLGSKKEIDVRGNGLSIVDGDITPSTTDNTDFGTSSIGAPLQRSFTVHNTGTAALNISNVTRSGPDAAMFSPGPLTPGTMILPGGSANLTVTFTPTAAGMKTATLTILSNDCDESQYDFVLRGIGAGCDRTTCVGHSLPFTPTATNGTSYAWNFGDGSTSTATAPYHSYAAAGNYTVQLTLVSSSGCTTTSTQRVCVYAAPNVTSALTQPLCSNSPTGAIDLTVTGGAPGTTFTYLWSTGQTTQDRTGLAAGNYAVTVTDPSTNCTQTLAFTLTNQVLPSLTITPSGPTTFCQGGSVSLNAGAGYTSYLWSTGATSASITATTSGTYSVTVTNAQGCQVSASQVVTVNPLPAVAITQVGNGCANGSSTILTATTGYVSYVWSNGATGNPITVTTNGNFTVTATNTFGCTNTATATVNPGNSCPTPTDLPVTVTGTSATLNWTAAPCALSYQIQYRVVGTNPPGITVTVNAPATSVTITGLTVNTNYEWRIKSDCGPGANSAWSDYKTFTTGNAKMLASSAEATTPEPTLFPNPNDGKFTVKYDAAEMGEVEVCVWDMTGKRVFCENKVTTEGENTWEMDFKLAAGVYYFKIQPQTPSKSEAKRLKFVVE